MGIFSRIKRGYTNIDSRLGGYLPGGVKPGENKETVTTTTTTPTITKISTPPAKVGETRGGYTTTVVSPSQTYSGGGGQAVDLSQELTQRGSTPEKAVYYDTQPTTEEKGVLTVSDPKQAQTLKNKGVAFYQPLSKSPSQSITEASFVGEIPQKSRALKTRGLYEYNTKNIIAGKEVYSQYSGTVSAFEKDPSSFEGRAGVITTQVGGGTQYQLTPSYFENTIDFKGIQTNALIGAKDQFKTLPRNIRYSKNILGFGVGVSSAVIGIGEFGGNIVSNFGQQTFKPGEFSKPRSFKFGGTLGKIRNYPTTQSTVTFLENPKSYVGQKFKSPEFLGGATVIAPLTFMGVKSVVGNIKAYGFKGGVAETASSLSPLKIRSGIYAQPITDKTTFSNVRSYKTASNGVTTRTYYGSSGSVKLSGAEKSVVVGGKTVGVGASVTKTPFLEIRGGGLYVKPGVRTTSSPYVFSSGGSGTAYGGTGNKFYTQMIGTTGKGGISNVIYSRGVTAYKYNAGGGFYSYNNPTKLYKVSSGGGTQDITKQVKYFTTGQSKPIYETVGRAGDLKIYQPSTRSRFLPRVSGVEFDLTKLGGGGAGRVISSGSGTKLVKGFGGSVVGGAVVPVVKPITTYKPTTILISQPSPQTQATQSKFYGMGTYERTEGGLMPPGTVEVASVNKVGSSSINALVPASKNIIRSGSRNKQIAITIPTITTITKPKQIQETISATKTIQVRKVALKYAKPTFSTFSGYGFGGSTYAPYTPTPSVPIIPFLAGGSGMSLKMGNIGMGQSPARYTPSFKALFFKIRGKAPTGVRTGINFRPITKGFSFQRVRRVRRVRV